MNRLLLIPLLCCIVLADIEKVDEVALPYWESRISDPNELEPYMRELVSELEKVINQIRDAVNHGVDLDNPDIRYFDLPDAAGVYANDTWRMITDGNDLVIQKKIDETWTEIAKWAESGYIDFADFIDGTANQVTVTDDGDNTVTLSTPQDIAAGSSPTFVKTTLSGNEINIATSQTPGASGAMGTQGDIAWDSGYVYICVSTNTWKRAALSVWGQENVIYAGEDVIFAGENVVYP